MWTTVLFEALKITGLVSLMMVVVDLVETRSQGRLVQLLQANRWRQYLLAALLGVTPGCLGAFVSVSLYVHGRISFGAIVAAMVATSGDESFVMLALFPKWTLVLFGILFLVAVGAGWLADEIADRLAFRPLEGCRLQEYHPGQESLRHYLKHHVAGHILVRHAARVFVWTFGALLSLEVMQMHWDLEGLVQEHTGFILLLSALVGLIPESGPNLIFVTMFANGLVPFSVLLTNSIVQDGHGMLPLLASTIRDAIWVKLFNMATGLLMGGGFLLAGF